MRSWAGKDRDIADTCLSLSCQCNAVANKANVTLGHEQRGELGGGYYTSVYSTGEIMLGSSIRLFRKSVKELERL